MHEQQETQKGILVFSESELKEAVWEHNDEFRLHHALFDVKKVTTSANGERQFHCVQDALETKLEGRCEETGLSPAHSNDSKLRQRNTALSFDWYKAESAQSLLSQFSEFDGINRNTFWSPGIARIQSGYPSTPSIPPECNAS